MSEKNNRLDSLSMSRLTVWAADNLAALQQEGKTQVLAAAIATEKLGFLITAANIKRVSVHLKIKWPRNGTKGPAKPAPSAGLVNGAELAIDDMHDTLKLILHRLEDIIQSLQPTPPKENPRA